MSTVQESKTVVSFWPRRVQAGIAVLQFKAKRFNLADLPCHIIQGQQLREFSQLTLEVEPKQQTRLSRWTDKLDKLGHTHDVQIQLPQHCVQLYRPVCIDRQGCQFTLAWLHQPVGLNALPTDDTIN
jgi:hypothetical protein